jgi:hypothetical protein
MRQNEGSVSEDVDHPGDDQAARAGDTVDSTTIISLAQTRTADTSVGLNARAVLNTGPGNRETSGTRSPARTSPSSSRGKRTRVLQGEPRRLGPPPAGVDLNGSTDDDVTTVQFHLDKTNYEIDLTATNEARLRDRLARFLDAATPAAPPRTPSRTKRTVKSIPAGRNQTQAVRDWAKFAG